MFPVIFILQLIVGGVYIHQVEVIDKWKYLNLSECLYKKRNAELVWEKRRDIKEDTEIIAIRCIP